MLFKRKKAEEKDVAEVLETVATEVNEELERRLFRAQAVMHDAEEAFMETLNVEQKKLFEEWSRAKQECQDLYAQKNNI